MTQYNLYKVLVNLLKKMGLGIDALASYLFVWIIVYKLAAVEKEAEKEFREPRSKL